MSRSVQMVSSIQTDSIMTKSKFHSVYINTIDPTKLTLSTEPNELN
jgi:hypothetical protein